MSTTPRRHRLTIALAAMLAAALLAAGCGGGSGYKDDVEKAAKTFTQESRDANTKVRGAKTKAEFSAGVDDFQAAVRKFNSKLKSLKPTSGAKAAQARLITTLDTMSSDIGAFRDAVNKQDVTRLQELQGKVLSDAAAVAPAAKELEDKAK